MGGAASACGSPPSVALVVVARDGFCQAPARLKRLLHVTTGPYRLIYVDGGAPAGIARTLRRMVLESGGTVVRADAYLRPTQARNLGLRHADTRYVCFIDNDVDVTERWLERLVACAEETGADYVSPVIRQRLKGRWRVHLAGGANSISTSGSRRRLMESYAHMHAPWEDVSNELRRHPVSMAEFHAVLVRTATLRKLGGLDESCSTAFEHNDFCLSVAALGGKGWLEPRAVVEWIPEDGRRPGNFRYYLLRWSGDWIEQSFRAFCAKWNLQRDDPAFTADLQSLHARRRIPFRHVRRELLRLTGPRSVDLFDAFADRLVTPAAETQPGGEGRGSMIRSTTYRASRS